MVPNSHVHSLELEDNYAGLIAHSLNYYAEMHKRSRVIQISDMQGVAATVTYFLCSTLEQCDKLYQKALWEIPDDNPNGEIIYIDKLISRTGWHLSIRKMINDTVILQYPQVKMAVWYRPTEGHDRRYVYRRKY